MVVHAHLLVVHLCLTTLIPSLTSFHSQILSRKVLIHIYICVLISQVDDSIRAGKGSLGIYDPECEQGGRSPKRTRFKSNVSLTKATSPSLLTTEESSYVFPDLDEVFKRVIDVTSSSDDRMPKAMGLHRWTGCQA